ncbi:hypothetical protein T492DRAFT_834225 [Pavlovales sp. CCMP2436]|nr:hypothetical protein T492DRAFT_834225 [Pavlovales sp. CCMP2436]
MVTNGTSDSVVAQLDTHLAEGLAAARALVGAADAAGSCVRAAELQRDLGVFRQRGEAHVAARTAAVLAEHQQLAAEAAAAAAAAAEADLLSATVGAAERLAAAAALAAERANDAADVRRMCDAATQATASRTALLTAALKKGMTPGSRAEAQKELKATQALAAQAIPRIEEDMAEEVEAGRRAAHKRNFVKHNVRANELMEQLTAAKVTLEEATARAKAGPTLSDLEAALKKQYAPQDLIKAEAAARTKLGWQTRRPSGWPTSLRAQRPPPKARPPSPPRPPPRTPRQRQTARRSLPDRSTRHGLRPR